MEPNFQIEIVTANVGRPRRETLNGRDFLVAPATLIVGDAVLNGSQGALLYPATENERDPQAWNGMPLVAWHPVKVVNGVRQHVSARNPEILNEWGLGHFYHANALESHVEGNLDGEAWFDVENVKAVDAKLVKRGVDPILPRLLGGQQIELSTGLFTKNKQADPGVRNAKGDPYTGIATNYRPDHVAILPDEVGACSVDHGCGVNNQAGVFRSVINAVAKALGINSSLVRPEQPVENEPSDTIDPDKACQILKDGSINGESLTDDQRGMFGAACGQTTNRGDCCAGKRPDQMCEECRAMVTANAWIDADFDAILNEKMCWGHPCGSSDAASGEAVAASKEAILGTTSRSRSKHEAAAQAHSKAHAAHKAEFDKTGSEESRKKMDQHHRAAMFHQEQEATATHNSAPWTDADFEAVLNARMCWGRPCGDGGAESKDESGYGGGRRKNPDNIKLRDMETPKVLGYELDRATLTPIRKPLGAPETVSLGGPGQYESGNAEHESTIKKLTDKGFHGTVDSFKRGKILHEEASKLANNSKENRTMPLTKIQRDKMVRHLTTNCACKIKPAVLNEMDDDALEQTHNAHNLILVVNAAKGGKLGKVTVNADGEGEAVPGVPWVKLAGILGVEVDPRTDPIQFAAEMKDKLSGIVSKLAGDAPPPADEPTPGDAPVVSADPEPEPDEDDDMTGNRRAPQLTQEQREDLAFAANMKREHKIGLVRRLLEHVPLANRKARGDKLFKLSIAELEDRIADLPVENARQPQQPQIDWSLAGGSSPTLNQADQESDDQVVELMTNADEEYRQMILKAKTA